MSSLNKVILLGKLGQDPSLKNTHSGTSVCTLNIATTDYRKDAQGNRQEVTEWHRVVVWGKSAENCGKYLQKGSSAMIEGKLQTRSWEDNQGNKKYTTEIVAQNVQFVGPKPQQQQNQGYNEPPPPQQQDSSSFSGHDTPGIDDIPF